MAPAVPREEAPRGPAPAAATASTGTPELVLKRADYEKIRKYFDQAVESQKRVDDALGGYKKTLKDLGEALDSAKPLPPKAPPPPAKP